MKPRSVYDYYKGDGWAKTNGVHHDTLVNENMQTAAIRYNTDTRRRVLHST